MSIALNDESSLPQWHICRYRAARAAKNVGTDEHKLTVNWFWSEMLKCLRIEAKIFWLVEDSKVIFILFIVIIIPNIQLSRHQETKIQALFKTTPQQLINLINLLPFWNQFNQTEVMFSPLIAPSFPQVLYTLWKTYKQAKVFFSSKIRLKIPVACHLTVRCKWTKLTFHNQGWHTLPLMLIIGVSLLNLGVLC